MTGREPRTLNPALAQPGVTAPPQFDRIARLYRWAEYLALGPMLTLTRRTFLHRLTGCRQALLLGDGDGRFTAALLRSAPQLQARAVDGSRTMLHLLQRRCHRDGNGNRLRTEHASVLAAKAGPQIDLIATHFLLDCLSQAEVDQLALTLAGQVHPGCLWVISEFGYPEHPVGSLLARAYIRLLYAAFGLLTGLVPQQLPNHASALGHAGFQLIARRQRWDGFLYAELWQLPPTAP